MSSSKILDWLKENLRTRRNWGVVLTAFVPMALVLGRTYADIAVSVVAILFLIDSIVCHRWDWAKKPWVVAALLLWGYSVARAAFISGDGGAGLAAAFVWLRYIVFAASMSDWALAEEKGKTWLLYACAGAALFMSIDGLIQYVFRRDIFGHELFENTRLTGPFKRPILGMTIAGLFAPPVFWLLARKQILYSVLLAGVCYAAIFFSGDRMGHLFAFVLMVVWFVFLMRTVATPMAFLALAACFFVSLCVVSPDHVKRQFQSTSATAQAITSSPYGLVWKSALDVGKTNPLFGVGMRQFRKVCLNETFGPVVDPASNSPRCYTHPHNHYLEWFSEGGIAGLLGFAGFVSTVALGFIRRLKAQKGDLVLWGLSVVLAVRLAPLFVTTSFFNNWGAIPFWLVLGWAMSYKSLPVAFKYPTVFKKS